MIDYRLMLLLMATLRTCTDCGKVKVLGAFHSNPLGRLGRASRCKPCVSTRKRNYYQARKAGRAWKREAPERKPSIRCEWKGLRSDLVPEAIREAIRMKRHTRESISDYVRERIGPHGQTPVMDEVMEVIAKLTLEQRELTVKRINGEAFFKLRRIA